jgi:hypothetical protein
MRVQHTISLNIFQCNGTNLCLLFLNFKIKVTPANKITNSEKSKTKCAQAYQYNIPGAGNGVAILTEGRFPFHFIAPFPKLHKGGRLLRRCVRVRKERHYARSCDLRTFIEELRGGICEQENNPRAACANI